MHSTSENIQYFLQCSTFRMKNTSALKQKWHTRLKIIELDPIKIIFIQFITYKIFETLQ